MKNKCIAAHDTWAANYDKEAAQPFFALLDQYLEEVLKKFMPPSGEVIDIAGGTGKLAVQLVNQGYKVTFTELSDKMIEICRARKGAEKLQIIKSDMTNMHMIKNNAFDFTFCVGNAMSYTNAEQALAEMKRITKRKSFIVFDVHSYYEAERKCIAEKDSKKFTRLEKTHLDANGVYDEHSFTIEELENLVKESGLKLVTLFGKMILANGNVKVMNRTLKDKKFAKTILQKELSIFGKREYLSCALELGAVCQKV